MFDNSRAKHFFIVLCLFLATPLCAQYAPDYNNGPKLNIYAREDYYIQVMLWDQLRARVTENNPGTLIKEHPQSTSYIIGAWRLRVLAVAQLSPSFMVMTRFGINRQAFVGGGAAGSEGIGPYRADKKPGMLSQGCVGEYTVFPSIDPYTAMQNNFSLPFGTNGHYFSGLSCRTMASTLNFLALASPSFFGEKDKVQPQPFFACTRKNHDAVATGDSYREYGTNLSVPKHPVAFLHAPRPVSCATDLMDRSRGGDVV
ncbi:hypothetical protein FVR03_20470 [Pontibacter qinzhouensis]|uniref:Porin n=1 Tax=Pontibacter qinzhouensis TaxID=2603253 RepID=A0A5C8J333_9BACT|nr:hypothetical protein [Pontibacter qinzhouensis]TXK29647.1 hypothetical protein FVR03_20470 [Pontibacter qinzhouensis]